MNVHLRRFCRLSDIWDDMSAAAVAHAAAVAAAVGRPGASLLCRPELMPAELSAGRKVTPA
jgi:hypothetical protein